MGGHAISAGEARRSSWLDAVVIGAAAALILWLLRVQPALDAAPGPFWKVAVGAAAVVLGCSLAAVAVLTLSGARPVTSGVVAVLAVSGSVVGAMAITVGPGGRYLDVVSGSLLGLVAVLGSVRELVARRVRSALVADLERQVRTDDLTGLPNRRDLLELVERERDRAGTAVVEVGIDSFYEYNAQLGATLGDEALRSVARALRDAAPSGWTVHRLGGDQFVLRGPGDAAAGLTCARAALAAVAAASVPGSTPLSASAGVAATHPGAADPTAVLADASAALRATKKAQDGGTAVHDTAMAASSQRHQAVTAALRRALAHDGVVAHLQPVVDIPTGRTSGVELLARWNDAELGHVRPDEFVPLAESTGLVHPLGTSVLRHGLQAYVAAGGLQRRLRVAVNASVHELRRPDYTQRMRATAAACGVPLELITVEVTESLFVARDDPGFRTLLELDAAGVALAIDDFGTGFSSLSYLERLPVTYVKVDRSLVAAASRSERSRALLAAIASVSRAMELQVIAEGIEDQAQACMVSEFGIVLGQGWLWSKALTPEEFVAHLAVPSQPGPSQSGPSQPGPSQPGPSQVGHVASGERQTQESVVAGGGAPARRVVGQHPQ
ncbi:diguanylate cyclase (GGDEF) domain-containing protein [Quadrisphaera granulorum]|uniref:Diguanylate cyclase (GGDEF)-like protein n=1 Tax=Quadrisphaera granulorum TaxID=317664 RepID=A0A316AFH1_9ACTN|nr:bifunctional diguanylate cyclase/phosphodiesterase [Quadrisphaera granulorum]PWJ56322.1 diguanylate cyclase (GGDEF)-like protein [Quadrisphaera granulorum]SZE94956.1 diguanylate cyclase (GGDEF) domain-containing protein [Quadrisphaera granulorum]